MFTKFVANFITLFRVSKSGNLFHFSFKLEFLEKVYLFFRSFTLFFLSKSGNRKVTFDLNKNSPIKKYDRLKVYLFFFTYIGFELNL